MEIILTLKFIFFCLLVLFFHFPFLKVKKGLEKLYCRIEKDITEEVGMLRDGGLGFYAESIYGTIRTLYQAHRTVLSRSQYHTGV